MRLVASEVAEDDQDKMQSYLNEENADDEEDVNGDDDSRALLRKKSSSSTLSSPPVLDSSGFPSSPSFSLPSSFRSAVSDIEREAWLLSARHRLEVADVTDRKIDKHKRKLIRRRQKELARQEVMP